MADFGKLYAGFTPEFAKKMAELCAQADVIVPNITEACFMLGEEYREGSYTEDYIDSLLEGLAAELGASKIILTGVMYRPDEIGAAIYDSITGEKGYVSNPYIPGSFHGTGDVFASAALAGILNGMTIKDAAQLAADFTAESIQRTVDAGTDIRFGVDFEESIPNLLKHLGKID